jgi:type II secretory pathway predicted ATPase ExeA
LLSNVNEAGELALQTILVGQPELRDTLSRQELRQFAQRISADYHLRPFTFSETVEYVRHRLVSAGGSADRFDDAALQRIYTETSGIPRLINRLCDMALVYGYATKQSVIDGAILEEVVTDRENVGALSMTGTKNDAGKSAAP